MLLENFQVSYLHNAQFAWPTFYIPVRAPIGSEIIMRQQSSTGGLAVTVMVSAIGPPVGNRGRVTFGQTYSYGAVSTGSKGTTLTLPGATQTRGPWVEIATATDEDFYALGIGLGIDWGPGLTTADYLMDVAIGPAGSEEVILDGVAFQTSSAEIIFNPIIRTLPAWAGRFIPAGTRLAARSQASSLFTPPNVTLHGFARPAGFHYRRGLASSGGLTARLEG